MGDSGVRQMRVSLQAEGIEENSHKDQKHQFAGLLYVLGTGSATVTIRYVPRVRPTGFTES